MLGLTFSHPLGGLHVFTSSSHWRLVMFNTLSFLPLTILVLLYVTQL